jgi:hypothetical protein
VDEPHEPTIAMGHEAALAIQMGVEQDRFLETPWRDWIARQAPIPKFDHRRLVLGLVRANGDLATRSHPQAYSSRKEIDDSGEHHHLPTSAGVIKPRFAHWPAILRTTKKETTTEGTTKDTNYTKRKKELLTAAQIESTFSAVGCRIFVHFLVRRLDLICAAVSNAVPSLLFVCFVVPIRATFGYDELQRPVWPIGCSAVTRHGGPRGCRQIGIGKDR